MLVIVHTATRRYAIRRDDLTAMQVVASAQDLAGLSSVERPAIAVDLGSLLDPADQSNPGRKHGLVVPLRRRPIVFLVERVEQAIEQPTIQQLPALIKACLHDMWAIGVLDFEDHLLILLDLRAIARSIMAQRAAANR
jgi:chemotaxis signal transduction protein